MAYTNPSPNLATIRIPPASWEYATYADFKAGMRNAAEGIKQQDHMRHAIPDVRLLEMPDANYTLQRLAEQAIRHLKANEAALSGMGKEKGMRYQDQTKEVQNQADVLSAELNQLILFAKGKRYFNHTIIQRIQSIIKLLGPLGGGSGKYSQSQMNMSENFQDLIQKLNDAVVGSVMQHNQNVKSMFENSLKRVALPEGVTLTPENAKRVGAKAASQMIHLSFTPTTESNFRAMMTVQEGGKMNWPSAGYKYTYLPVSLGKLTQGLNQIDYFGALRYWYYMPQVRQEIKMYLAERYLKLYADQANLLPIAIYKGDKVTTNFNFADIVKVNGLSGMGAPINTPLKYLVGSASDAAIRTWIAHKNIGPTSGISGAIRFAITANQVSDEAT